MNFSFTLILNIDSDGDGLLDVYETETGIFNGPEDTGTDPNNPDSDGDGRNDGREVNQETDPNVDTDFSGIPDIQREALVDLYNATDGANWADNTGWLGEPESECNWIGVTCDGSNTWVAEVDLGSNNLAGTIPPTIVNLTDLQNLNLANNQLIGTHPDGLERTNRTDPTGSGLQPAIRTHPRRPGQPDRFTGPVAPRQPAERPDSGSFGPDRPAVPLFEYEPAGGQHSNMAVDVDPAPVSLPGQQPPDG